MLALGLENELGIIARSSFALDLRHLMMFLGSYLVKRFQKKHQSALEEKQGCKHGGNNAVRANQLEGEIDKSYLNSGMKEQATKNDDHLTPAERKYLEQWEKLDIKRLAKEASSLVNLIPKAGSW
ncbi:hypothetical protein RND71_032250 [Anisodus tanguticus]|uniref:Uncharacterized protein n=1 Tax=Anisodus tanguticus TaxID=243964 RepID=A0AAE1V6K3_9SOLA|nr:hypothetical protein RND71_032250 [Anisodus tanguticus]